MRIAPDHGMDISSLLPEPKYRIHAETIVRARPERVWNELLALKMRHLPVTFALTLLRHAPALVIGKEGLPHRAETFLEATPIPVVLVDAPQLVISAGASQPWKLFGGETPPPISATDFAEWNQPGWLKVAMQFRIEARGDQTLLTTETRISVDDPSTARAFAPYWYLIRAGSVLIRREVIARVAKRAES